MDHGLAGSREVFQNRRLEDAARNSFQGLVSIIHNKIMRCKNNKNDAVLKRYQIKHMGQIANAICPFAAKLVLCLLLTWAGPDTP